MDLRDNADLGYSMIYWNGVIMVESIAQQAIPTDCITIGDRSRWQNKWYFKR